MMLRQLLPLGKSKTLECIIYKSLKDSSRNLSKETLVEENYPLLTYSRSIDVLDDSMQYATDSKLYNFSVMNMLHVLHDIC